MGSRRSRYTARASSAWKWPLRAGSVSSIRRKFKAQVGYQTHLCVPIKGGDGLRLLDAVSEAILKTFRNIQVYVLRT